MVEDFLNKLVYTPYSDEILSNIPRRNTRNRSWRETEAKEYVSKYYYFWDRNDRVRRSCEIGVLGHLIEGIEDIRLKNAIMIY